MSDVPWLNGLTNYSIRVVYYNRQDAEWVSVPFQIDEVGGLPPASRWADGDYEYGYPTPDLGPVGYVGPDQNGMDIDDEFVFYAHAGAHVEPTMWWEGDANGTYPYRIEMTLKDPLDGGLTWVYIYYDIGKNHTDFDWKVDYPVQGWNVPQSYAYSDQFYYAQKSATNPDLEIDIEKYDESGFDFVNESMKSYSSIIYTVGGMNWSVTTGREGVWNNTAFSDSKTEIDQPETVLVGPSGWDTERVDAAVISGPVRTILNKKLYSIVNVTPTDFYTTLHHQYEFFYVDRKKIQNEKIFYVPSFASAGYVDYDYSQVTSLNTSTRNQYVVYDGWVSEGYLRKNLPNGRPNETILGIPELIATLGPTSSNPKAPVVLNGNPFLPISDIPDFFLFASDSHGSMLMTTPRYAMGGGLKMGTYWRDDNETSEIGIVIADTIPMGALIWDMYCKYLPSISTDQQAREVGINSYREFYTPLNKNFQRQIAPVDYWAPEIFDPIQKPFPATNNASTMIYVVVEDNANGTGVHKVILHYDNGTGIYDVPMAYKESFEVYEGKIPKHPYQTKIVYWISANDTYGNWVTTAFDYLGYSFDRDEIGGQPEDMVVVEPPATTLRVMSAAGDHRRVAVFWDNNNFPGAGPALETPVWPSSNGTFEMWLMGFNGTNSRFYMDLNDTIITNTIAIQIEADWSMGANTLSYWNGGFIPIMTNFNDSVWHHIRITYNCSTVTFDIWVDGIYQGNYPFGNPVPIISGARWSTDRVGFTDSYNEATAMIDGLDANWADSYYYSNRNNGTVQTSRDYFAKYSFEDQDPRDEWVLWNYNNSHIDLYPALQGHKNVIEFFDGAVDAACGMTQNFTAQTNGTIEWWMNGVDASGINGKLYIKLFDSYSNPAIILRANWDSGANILEYLNPGSIWQQIASGFSPKKWQHVRLEFNCTLMSFDIWVNGSYKGIMPFSSPLIINNIGQISIETGKVDTYNNYFAYIDAIDYSWAPGYYINRNMDYVVHGIRRPGIGNVGVGFNFTVTDPFPPAQVKGVTVTNTGIGNTLNVSWNPGEADVKYYLVWMSTSVNGTYYLQDNVTAPITSTLISSLTDGLTYYFMVQAIDGVPYFGPNSTKKAGIPSDITPPAQVTGVTINVIPTGNELNVSWNANSELDFVKYMVYRSTVASFPIGPIYWIANTTNTFYHDMGLTDGTTYWYKITAIDDGGPSENQGLPSSPVGASPEDTTPPAQVQNVNIAVIPTGNKLNISWDPNSESDLFRYRIYRSLFSPFTPNPGNWIANTTNTYYLDENLVDGTPYYYIVTAVDDGGPAQNEGPGSAISSGTPWDSVAPAAVTILSVSPISTGNALNITWTLSSAEDIVGYYLYNSTAMGGPYTLTATLSHPINFYIHSGLSDGVTMWYIVSPFDEVPNPGDNSTAVSGIPQDSIPPGQVTGVAVTNLGTGNTLNITWSAGSATDIQGYIVYRALASAGPYEIAANVPYTTTFFLDTGRIDGTTYYYKISAY
ncbi:MAG: hypothetical protein ACTSQI_20540, partial [Candidatus Helarchaeota archaeon]